MASLMPRATAERLKSVICNWNKGLLGSAHKSENVRADMTQFKHGNATTDITLSAGFVVQIHISSGSVRRAQVEASSKTARYRNSKESITSGMNLD
jgi:hypothetical protein